MFFLLIFFLAEVVLAIRSISQADFPWHSLTFFPPTVEAFIDTLGTFSLAFICHPTILASLKTLTNKRLSSHVVIFGYLNTVLIYAGFGVFGTLSIANRAHTKDGSYLDFFTESYLTLFFGLCFCLYLTSIIGIFTYVSKEQFLPILLPGPGMRNSPLYRAMSVLLVFFAVLMQFLNVKIDLVIGFCGAVMAFLVCFLYPVLIHLKCMRGEHDYLLEAVRSTVSDDDELNRSQPALS